MFDFSKYNLGELNAIVDILQYIDEGGRIDYQQEKCREAIHENMSRQVTEQTPVIKCGNILDVSARFDNLCNRYNVCYGGPDGVVAGEGMDIDHALLFAKDILVNYWCDKNISLTINKEVLGQ